MTTPRSNAAHSVVPPWMLAVVAMLVLQLGAALSVGLFDKVGSSGTAWLRLAFGAVILLVVAPPPIRSVRRRDVLPLLTLGVVTGLVTVSFLAAIDRIPLGTAVAIEFLGPMTVAAVWSRSRRALVWPALAMVGVILLTSPWAGPVNVAGVTFASLAAVGWGTYIVLTRRVGDRFPGIRGLSFTIPVAAIATSVVGIPHVSGHLTPEVLLAAAGLAFLMPVLPFALELLALRSMTHMAFGTLMALEPAFGQLFGVLILHQKPTLIQVLGVVLVVAAGSAAQRGGRRDGPAVDAIA